MSGQTHSKLTLESTASASETLKSSITQETVQQNARKTRQNLFIFRHLPSLCFFGGSLFCGLAFLLSSLPLLLGSFSIFPFLFLDEFLLILFHVFVLDGTGTEDKAGFDFGKGGIWHQVHRPGFFRDHNIFGSAAAGCKSIGSADQQTGSHAKFEVKCKPAIAVERKVEAETGSNSIERPLYAIGARLDCKVPGLGIGSSKE